MHEAPQVLHYGMAGQGMKLKPGMTFTIEPMVNQGGAKTKTKLTHETLGGRFRNHRLSKSLVFRAFKKHRLNIGKSLKTSDYENL